MSEKRGVVVTGVTVLQHTSPAYREGSNWSESVKSSGKGFEQE